MGRGQLRFPGVKKEVISHLEIPTSIYPAFDFQRAQEDSDIIVSLHPFKDHRPLKSLNKIHHFNDFKVCSSVSVSVSTMLGKHHCLTLPLPWQPLATPCPGLWVSAYELASSGHFISVISLFYLNHVFKVHPCYTMRYIYIYISELQFCLCD